MADDIRTSKHDLIARVATLELLVSDLVELLWQVNPGAMDRLAHDADHDLMIQHNRTPLPAAENQRARLYSVLQDRKRRLQHRRGRQGAAA